MLAAFSHIDDASLQVLGIGYASDSVNAVEVANALYGRGCAQFCGFHLADAMKSFSESLNWKLAALGEDDPGLACIFYQMAHVYLEQSEPEEAITCFEEYARLQKLETQRNLHDNAEICYAEGIVAKLKGRQDAALSFFKQALAMFDTLFGGDHEKVASINVRCMRHLFSQPVRPNTHKNLTVYSPTSSLILVAFIRRWATMRLR